MIRTILPALSVFAFLRESPAADRPNIHESNFVAGAGCEVPALPELAVKQN